MTPIIIQRVLAELANHANDGTDTPVAKSWAWPANETLAKEAGCSVSTVKRVLKFATELGFFEHVVNRQKEQGTTRYKFREVIEVDGKEVFRSDFDPEKAWTAPVLPTLVPSEPRAECLGTKGGLAPTDTSLSSCGAKGVVPRELRVAPTDLSLSSTGTTNTIIEYYQEGYHVNASIESKQESKKASVLAYDLRERERVRDEREWVTRDRDSRDNGRDGG